jgi:hypothetical protein
MDEIITNNMDKDLIKEFKISMGSETNSDVDDDSFIRSCNTSVNGIDEMYNNSHKRIINLTENKYKNSKLDDENEIDKIFYGINKSCDSIINNNDVYEIKPEILVNKSVNEEIAVEKSHDNSETIPEPVQETIPESIPEPVQETIPESIPEPVQETIPESIPEPVQETIPESIPEPVQETIPEPISEPVPEPVQETI